MTMPLRLGQAILTWNLPFLRGIENVSKPGLIFKFWVLFQHSQYGAAWKVWNFCSPYRAYGTLRNINRLSRNNQPDWRWTSSSATSRIKLEQHKARTKLQEKMLSHSDKRGFLNSCKRLLRRLASCHSYERCCHRLLHAQHANADDVYSASPLELLLLHS